MILDKQNLFSEDQAVTATADSTNIIDLGDDLDLGLSSVIETFVQVTTDFATLTSLTVSLVTSADEAFSSPVTLVSSAAIAAADLVAGKQFSLRALPHDTDRYVKLTYTVGGSDATAGKIFAGLALDRQTNGVM